MKRPQLIAFDLDGTTVRDGKYISHETMQAIKSAHEAGCVTVVATGRAHILVPPQMADNPDVDYLITSGGARLIRRGAEEAISERILDKNTVLRIMRAMRVRGAAFTVQFYGRPIFEYGALMRFILTTGRAQRKEHGEFSELVTHAETVASAAREVRRGGDIEKFGAVFWRKKDAERLRAVIHERFGVETALSHPHEIEITAAGVSKGSSIAQLLEALNIKPEGAAAIGDSGNDLSMREEVGCFISMGNASEDVKEAADFVVPGIDEDGAAKAIRMLLRGECEP